MLINFCLFNKGIFMMVIDGVKADGYIFGVALNYKCLYQRFESIFNEKPVLFIKTPNTRSISGQKIFKRKGDVVQAGPCVGVVIGQTTSRRSVTQAEQSIAGYVVVNELSLPEESYYRPVVKAKCQDGFCVIGDVVEKIEVTDS
jgi:5-oxopent-3-ene-1,2,5-tricarboxylate decarboxylase/2-hydroxyhepta-2,4-diene-1,7-dioate isomerase